MVRCKFKCVSKREYEGWGAHVAGLAPRFYEYEFQVVTSGSEENTQFFASTPGGTLKVSVVRDGTFEVGKEYFVDLSQA